MTLTTLLPLPVGSVWNSRWRPGHPTVQWRTGHTHTGCATSQRASKCVWHVSLPPWETIVAAAKETVRSQTSMKLWNIKWAFSQQSYQRLHICSTCLMQNLKQHLRLICKFTWRYNSRDNNQSRLNSYITHTIMPFYAFEQSSQSVELLTMIMWNLETFVGVLQRSRASVAGDGESTVQRDMEKDPENPAVRLSTTTQLRLHLIQTKQHRSMLWC